MNFTVDIVSETYLDESSEGLDVRLSDLMVILRGEDRGVRIAITRVSNGYRIECPGQEPEHLSSADELHRAYLKRVAAHWPDRKSVV